MIRSWPFSRAEESAYACGWARLGNGGHEITFLADTTDVKMTMRFHKSLGTSSSQEGILEAGCGGWLKGGQISIGLGRAVLSRLQILCLCRSTKGYPYTDFMMKDFSQ